MFWVISKIFWLLASPDTSIFLVLLAGVGLSFFGREKLGKKLKFLKEKWIENNFVLDKKIVDKSLNKVNRN